MDLTIDQTRRHSCMVFQRNGAMCRGQRLSHYLGPKEITLCTRHKKKWDEEAALVAARIQTEHEQGLHGQGDERKAFADRHDRGWVWGRCRPCEQEMASEELAVKPEQVDAALRIKRLMEADRQELANVASRIEQASSDRKSLISAVLQWSHRLERYKHRCDLWDEVENAREGRVGWQEVRPMNLVEAYDQIAELYKSKLIQNGIPEEDRRSVTSRWVLAMEER